MKYKIGWEKWIDPYSTDSLNGFNLAEEPIEEDEIDDLFTDGFIAELDEEYNGDDFNPIITSKPIKNYFTKMGPMPMYEHSLPSKIFKFYVGHTNFTITKPIVKIINDTEGIETLDIFTRYRFKVGIGKMFSSKEIRHNIEDNVYSYLVALDESKTRIETLKSELQCS